MILVKRPVHRFTSENAAQMQKAGLARKRAKADAAKAEVQALQAELDRVKPLVEAIRVVTNSDDSLSAVVSSQSYVAQRLARTRSQIDALDAQLLASDDPRAIQAISVAIRNLAEIERVLAGRPLPGSRRPGREKPTRGPATGGSLMADE